MVYLAVKQVDLSMVQRKRIKYVRSTNQIFLGIKSDPLVEKMINLLMRDGKRSKAEQVLNKVFQVLDERYPGRALHIFYF